MRTVVAPIKTPYSNHPVIIYDIASENIYGLFRVVIYGLLKEESRILIIFMSETQYGGTESVTYCWPKEK